MKIQVVAVPRTVGSSHIHPENLRPDQQETGRREPVQETQGNSSVSQ